MFTLATSSGFSKGGDNPHSYPKVGIELRSKSGPARPSMPSYLITRPELREL